MDIRNNQEKINKRASEIINKIQEQLDDDFDNDELTNRYLTDLYNCGLSVHLHSDDVIIDGMAYDAIYDAHAGKINDKNLDFVLSDVFYKTCRSNENQTFDFPADGLNLKSLKALNKKFTFNNMFDVHQETKCPHCAAKADTIVNLLIQPYLKSFHCNDCGLAFDDWDYFNKYEAMLTLIEAPSVIDIRKNEFHPQIMFSSIRKDIYNFAKDILVKSGRKHLDDNNPLAEIDTPDFIDFERHILKNRLLRNPITDYDISIKSDTLLHFTRISESLFIYAYNTDNAHTKPTTFIEYLLGTKLSSERDPFSLNKFSPKLPPLSYAFAIIQIIDTYNVKDKSNYHTKNISIDDYNPRRVFVLSTSESSDGFKDFKSITKKIVNKDAIFIDLFLGYNTKSEQGIKYALQALHFKKDDILCIIRGGGDQKNRTFTAFHSKSSIEILSKIKDKGVIIYTGVGHASNEYPICGIATHACITPTEVAYFVLEELGYVKTVK
ncbi:exodeoxyribonuclease VII large subunit [Photobacterium rosenbergii]|uniref:exodeoxyribonuclease VII large subunit n=1 Tax=Photobacterium rosenbergii TaxID=294936 RepID=UPI001C9A084A|nr:exodeoxyribonuclease VII large subunit [Photobacterium rosenbergii]MBY5948385.1 hypothetical protein [Photobacterium rosenbergii]